MGDKKIPTPEEFIKERYDFSDSDMERLVENMSKLPMIGFNNIPDLMQSYAKEVIKYTLEQAAEKAKIKYERNDWQRTSTTSDKDLYDESIDTQSILSLEGEIIKSLGL